MNIGMILRPLAAMNGISNFQIHLDAGNRQVIATGTHSGKPFQKTLTFEAVEHMINGTTPPPEDQKASAPAPNTPRAESDPPE